MTTCGDENATPLQIVWRNPDNVHAWRRHEQDQVGDNTRYVLQEFVYVGEFGSWTTIAALEVVTGGRVA